MLSPTVRRAPQRRNYHVKPREWDVCRVDKRSDGARHTAAVSVAAQALQHGWVVQDPRPLAHQSTLRHYEICRIYLSHGMHWEEEDSRPGRRLVVALRYRVFAPLHVVGAVNIRTVRVDRFPQPSIPAHRASVVGATEKLFVTLGADGMATVEGKCRINYGIVQANGTLDTPTHAPLLWIAVVAHTVAHCSRFCVCVCAEVSQQKARRVPQFFTEEDRKSFLAIGLRAVCEDVNCYTVASLGMQAYVTNRYIAESGGRAIHHTVADEK